MSQDLERINETWIEDREQYTLIPCLMRSILLSGLVVEKPNTFVVWSGVSLFLYNCPGVITQSSNGTTASLPVLIPGALGCCNVKFLKWA